MGEGDSRADATNPVPILAERILAAERKLLEGAWYGSASSERHRPFERWLAAISSRSMASYSVSVQRRDGSTGVFTMDRAKVIIGQRSGEIATLDSRVADPHAELHFDGRTVTYVDLGSRTGTFWPSGERVVGSVALPIGGALSFGGCVLTMLEIHPAPHAPASSQQAPLAAPSATQEPYQALPQPAAVHSPHQPAAAHDPPPGDGVFDQLLFHLRAAAGRYRRHFLNGVLTLGAVSIPTILFKALSSWIPGLGTALLQHCPPSGVDRSRS